MAATKLFNSAASIRGAVAEIETIVADFAITLANNNASAIEREGREAINAIKRELRDIESYAVFIQELGR